MQQLIKILSYFAFKVQTFSNFQKSRKMGRKKEAESNERTFLQRYDKRNATKLSTVFADKITIRVPMQRTGKQIYYSKQENN